MSSSSMPADLAGLDGPADFDETFREHYGPMVRSLAAACGDREAAADTLSERDWSTWTSARACTPPLATERCGGRVGRDCGSRCRRAAPLVS